MRRLEESRRESGIRTWNKRTILADEWGYARGLLALKLLRKRIASNNFTFPATAGKAQLKSEFTINFIFVKLFNSQFASNFNK